MNNAIKHYNVLRPAVLVRLNHYFRVVCFLRALCGFLMGVVLSRKCHVAIIIAIVNHYRDITIIVTIVTALLPTKLTADDIVLEHYVWSCLMEPFYDVVNPFNVLFFFLFLFLQNTNKTLILSYKGYKYIHTYTYIHRRGCNFLTGTEFPLVPPEIKHWLYIRRLMESMKFLSDDSHMRSELFLKALHTSLHIRNFQWSH